VDGLLFLCQRSRCVEPIFFVCQVANEKCCINFPNGGVIPTVVLSDAAL